MRIRTLLSILTAVALTQAAACDNGEGENHDEDTFHGEDGHESEAPATHACEHIEGGPAVAVVAAEFASKQYPDVSALHTRFDVALPDTSADGLGYLWYPAADAGDHILFLTEDVPVTILGPDGEEVSPEHSGGSPEECPSILTHHLVHMEIGTYTFVLGPADVTEVGLVVYVGGEEGHEHEEEHAD